MFKRIFVFYLMVSILSLAVIRPAQAAFAPAAIYQAGLRAVSVSPYVQAAALAGAWALANAGGKIALALRGKAAIFGATSLLGIGLMDVLQTPITQSTEVDRVTAGQDATGYRYVTMVNDGGNGCLMTGYTSAGAMNWQTWVALGSYTSYDPKSWTFDGSITCSNTTSENAGNFDSSTFFGGLFGFGTDTNGNETYNDGSGDAPIFFLPPDQADTLHLDLGLGPINFEQALWDSVPDVIRPSDYQGLSYAEALALANSLAGTTNGKLSDFNGLPLQDGRIADVGAGTITGQDGSTLLSDGSMILPDGTIYNPDGTVTNPDGATTSIDYGRLSSIFSQAINTATGTITSGQQIQTDSLRNAIAAQSTAIDTSITNQTDEIKTAIAGQTTALGTKLDEIKGVITPSQDDLNYMNSLPPIPPDPSVELATNYAQSDTDARQAIDDHTSDVLFGGLDDSMFDFSTSSSRSFGFDVVGQHYEMDMQPLFTLASLISVFLNLGALFLGYRIVARAW